jgi:hypothetical protein
MASDSNKSRCDKCGNVYTLLKLDNMEVCSKCYLIYNPPVLRIDKYKNDEDLWNRTQNKREFTMTIKDFLKCGWFLRKTEEADSKVPKFNVKKMHFEYYGKYKCIRFKKYYKDLSLVHLDDCKKPDGSCFINANFTKGII